MYVGLLVSVLFLSTIASATYVINVDDFIKEIRKVPVTPRSFFDSKIFLTNLGYPFEQHKVTTEDDYVLTLHRIPHGRNESNSKSRPAVLLMHGLLASSVDYFILGPDKSLALMLADAGYDVWLGNNRGNTWSRKHNTLDPDENATFWDFSFHEFGMYDVPATIDHIIEKTGRDQISYIGHSQGCSQFFAMASTKPEYNDKINIMVALAPPVFMQNLTNPIVQTVKNLYELFDLALNFLNVTELLPYTTLSSTLQVICDDDSGFQEVCATVLFFLVGFDTDQFDRSIFPTILQSLPAGSSARAIKHYLQEVKSGHFRPFDYGEETNMKIYNASKPQDYNLNAVTAPVALYYSENDWLVGLPDVERLIKSLPYVVTSHLIEYRMFNHLDFLFATDVVSLLYVDTINLVNIYNNLGPVTPPTRPPATTSTKATGTSVTQNSGSSHEVSTVQSTTPSSAPAALTISVMQGFCVVLSLFVIKGLSQTY